MQNRKMISLILIFSILPFVLCASACKTNETNGNSTVNKTIVNNTNCTQGNLTTVKVNNQIVLNGTQIDLSGASIIQLPDGVYTISSPIYVKSGQVLQGGNGTMIRASDRSDFHVKDGAMIYFENVNCSGIRNLSIDGNVNDFNEQWNLGGKGYESAILIGSGSKNILIDNITFYGLLGDGVKGSVSGSSNVLIQNCTFDRTGHDGVQDWDGNGWTIRNCYFNLFVNSGIRIADAENCLITGNYFTSNTSSGFSGVELENNVNGTNIIKNEFMHIHSHVGVGIATDNAHGTVNIFGNNFSDCPGGDIDVSGITVTNLNNTDTSGYIDTRNPDTICCIDNNGDVQPSINVVQTTIESFNHIIGISQLEVSDLMGLSNSASNMSMDSLNRAGNLSNGTSDEKEYAKELVNDSIQQEDIAKKLDQMKYRQLDITRENLNKTLL